MRFSNLKNPKLSISTILFAVLSLLESLSLAEPNNLLTKNQTVGEIPVNICSSPGECKILSSSGFCDADTFAFNSGKLSPANVGDAHIEVGFSSFQVFRRISLTNEGCEGLLIAQVSDDRVKWNEIAKMNFYSKHEIIEMVTGSVYSKYLRLSFRMPTAGKLGALKVFGEKTHLNYKVVQDETSKARVNFASGYGAERLVYSSELKDQLQTRLDSLDQALHFEPNERGSYVVVCDMRAERKLTEITSYYSAGVKSMSVFAVKNLPEKTNWKGNCILDKSDLEKNSVPVASVTSVGGNNSKVNIPDSVTSRYYVVAWQMEQLSSSQPLVVYGLGLIGIATVSSIDNFGSYNLVNPEFSLMPKSKTTIDTLHNNDVPIVAYSVGPGVLNSSYSDPMKEKSFSSKMSSALSNFVSSFRASPETVGTKANIRLLNCDYPSRAP